MCILLWLIKTFQKWKNHRLNLGYRKSLVCVRHGSDWDDVYSGIVVKCAHPSDSVAAKMCT